MKKHLFLTLIGVALGACSQAPMANQNTSMSSAEKSMTASCMGMSHDEMMKNAGCTDMMKKANMSDADMQKMMACHQMPRDAMINDQACMSMAKMHPDMMPSTR